MDYRVIYIPGIIDSRPWLQDKIIKLWSLSGLKTEYQAIGWKRSDFNNRLDELVARVDELAESRDKIALVGVSAGASAALNLYMARRDKISAVIFLCGKIHGTDIQVKYFAENPAFETSLFASDAAVNDLADSDKHKMLYLYTERDRTVYPSLNHIYGIKAKRIFGLGHISGIYLSLLFHGRLIAKFIKSRSKISN